MEYSDIEIIKAINKNTVAIKELAAVERQKKYVLREIVEALNGK